VLFIRHGLVTGLAAHLLVRSFASGAMTVALPKSRFLDSGRRSDAAEDFLLRGTSLQKSA